VRDDATQASTGCRTAIKGMEKYYIFVVDDCSVAPEGSKDIINREKDVFVGRDGRCAISATKSLEGPQSTSYQTISSRQEAKGTRTVQGSNDCRNYPLHGISVDKEKPMIVHNVLLKLQDPSCENIAKTKKLLLDMSGKIHEIRDLRLEVDILHAEPSYDLALFARFDTLEHFRAYLPHPVHVETLGKLQSVLAAVAIVSYEEGAPSPSFANC
jgi:hypothetical protein